MRRSVASGCQECHWSFTRDYPQLVASTTMWEIETNSVGNASGQVAVSPGQPSDVGSPPRGSDKTRLRAWGPSYARSRHSPALPLSHGLLRRRVGGRNGYLLAHSERQDDYRKGSPMDCPEPARSTGRTMLGKKRMWLWSCHGMSMALRTSGLCPGTSSSRPS